MTLSSNNLKTFLRHRSGPLVLIGLALATSGLFKVAAFAREAFIAAKFGLSAITDVYFALQQLPLIIATFMFGAFTLAFAPAFASSRRNGPIVAWLPGLTILGVLIGLALTGLMSAAAPLLLQAIHSDASASAWSTLKILSAAFAPIVCIGIWAGICTANGRNLWTMTMTGLPYLVMTLWLIGAYGAGMLNNLSLPVSMTAGFGLVGLYALVRIVLLQPTSFRTGAVLSLGRIAEFRAFLRQLGASSLENSGYAANQLLMLYFLSRIGTGIVSGNNCAMRIGMLGYNLLALPLAQLVQAKLCAANERDRPAQFQRWIGAVAVLSAVFAVTLFLTKVPIIRIVYMHGKFQGAALNTVASLLPAWICYIFVMSMNAIVARYLFIQSYGSTYVRRQLAAYAAANILRFALARRFDAPSIIWCSVASEGCAMLLNLRSCFALGSGEKLAASLPTASEVAG